MKQLTLTAAIALLFGATLPAQTARENIANARTQVLGTDCYYAPLSSVYDGITIQINKGQLPNSLGAIMNNYLIPMVHNSTNWQANIVDWAWPVAGCKGEPDEPTWMRNFAAGQWQTYQQLVNKLKTTGGCAPPPPPPIPQYVPAPEMAAAYSQVWGVASKMTPLPTNCPVAAGGVSCARTNLMAYTKTNPAVLNMIVPPVYSAAIGASPDSNQVQAVASSFLISWSGADDVARYLAGTKGAWQTKPATAALRLDTSGNVLDGNKKILLPNTMHSYYLSVSGTRIVAQGGGNYAV